MDRFLKYNGYVVEDAGAYQSDDFKSFARKMKNYLKRQGESHDIKIVRFSVGHYEVSGHLEKDGKYAYFSYSVPRWGRPINTKTASCAEGVLYRTARDEKDYIGGINHFTSLEKMMDDIRTLFQKAA